MHAALRCRNECLAVLARPLTFRASRRTIAAQVASSKRPITTSAAQEYSSSRAGFRSRRFRAVRSCAARRDSRRGSVCSRAPRCRRRGSGSRPIGVDRSDDDQQRHGRGARHGARDRSDAPGHRLRRRCAGRRVALDRTRVRLDALGDTSVRSRSDRSRSIRSTRASSTRARASRTTPPTAITGAACLRSTNGGDTWTQLGADVFVTATGGARIGHIVVDRATARLADEHDAARVDVVRPLSLDEQRHHVDASYSPANVSGLVADPVDSRVYYAAVGNYGATATANGVFKSTDRGVTWTPLPIAFGTTVGRIELAIAQSAPNVVYATVEDRTTGASYVAAVARHLAHERRRRDVDEDDGAGASCASQCWYDMYVEVDPTNAARVYFGGLSFYRSEDSAQTFTNVGTAIHVDHHAMVFDPFDPNSHLRRLRRRRLSLGESRRRTVDSREWQSCHHAVLSRRLAASDGHEHGDRRNAGQRDAAVPRRSELVGDHRRRRRLHGDQSARSVDHVRRSQWQSGRHRRRRPRRQALGGIFSSKNVGIT